MTKELRSIVEHYDSIAGTGQLAVLATLIDLQGSNYRLPGARMLIDGAGNTRGTVSGGCLEADLFERASRIWRTRVAEVLVYDTSINDESMFGLNLGCRGVVQILLEPAEPQLFEFFRHCLRSRDCSVIATLIQPNTEDGETLPAGARLLVDERGVVSSSFRDDITATLAADCFAASDEMSSRHRTYHFGEVFIECILPPVPLVVFGGGHDATPLVRFAKELGWYVTLVDHRPITSTRAQFSSADEIIIARPESAALRVPIDSRTVVVLMTHNYSHDLQLLEFLLRSSACYVGALGSRSRTEELLQSLATNGAAPEYQALEKLHAPVGIDIGAETPEEIALAIIAEIRAVLAGRSGGLLRDLEGSIHRPGKRDLLVAEVTDVLF